MAPDYHFRSASRLMLTNSKANCPGWQYTRNVNLGTGGWKSPNLGELVRLSMSHPAGLSVNLYNTLFLKFDTRIMSTSLIQHPIICLCM